MKIIDGKIDFIIINMPKKSKKDKRTEAEASGKKPKLTKQQENAGKSAKAKKAEQKAKKAAKRDKDASF